MFFSILLLNGLSKGLSPETRGTELYLGYLIDYLRDYSYNTHHYLITTEK